MPKVAFTISVVRKAGPYVAALENAGLAVDVLLPQAAPSTLLGFDGLVLGGGADVDPRLYGEDVAGSEGCHPERDEMELDLLAQARMHDIPVFGICRGLQLINVAYGGTLLQDIPGHTTPKGEPDPRHDVVIEVPSRLHEVVQTPRYRIISRHHQAVKALGAGLRVSARSDDGAVVEAVEDPSHPYLLAVQWHPEDNQACVEDRRLFEAFATAVRAASQA